MIVDVRAAPPAGLSTMLAAPPLTVDGAGWRTWVATREAAPTFRRQPGALAITLAADTASFGKWISPPAPVVPGRTYRCRVWYRTAGVPFPGMSAQAMLTWRGRQAPPWGGAGRVQDVDRGRDPALGGPRLVERRYLRPELDIAEEATDGGTDEGRTTKDEGSFRPSSFVVHRGEGWRRLEITMRAPAQAEMAELELWLRFAPGGQVWWRDAELREVPAQPPRLVTLGTVRATPQGKSTVEANRRLLAHLAAQAAGAGAGIVCLPENAVFHGTGLSYLEAAETIPGPTTDALGRVAAQRHIWLVAQVIERQWHRLYNSAILLGPDGRIAAVYHKMHPTTSELECGVVPGEGPVVAETDFGRVGLLVCYDMHFPESSRLTAAAGAEVICNPTVGDRWAERRDAVTRAHALTNGVFVVTSLVSQPSDIVDPEGRLLATASEPNSIATARVNLDYKATVEGRMIGPANGQHPGVYWAERRLDLRAT